MRCLAYLSTPTDEALDEIPGNRYEMAQRANSAAATLHKLRYAMGEVYSAHHGEGLALAQGLVACAGGWRTLKPYSAHTAAMDRNPIERELTHHDLYAVRLSTYHA